MILRSLISSVIAIFAVSVQPSAAEESSPVMKGLFSSLDVPLHELRDRPDGGFFSRLLDGFSGNLTVGVPLDLSTTAQLSGDGFRDRFGNTPTARATIKYNPIGNWFAAGTFYYYYDDNLQAEWTPDFSYVFGYDDWRPYTFSLIYSNYGGNRFSPDRRNGQEVTEFNEGTVQLGWKFPIPKKLARPFMVSERGGIGCIVAYNASPSYFDLASLAQRRWKQSASLGCKYAIIGNWYVNATAFYYPHGGQQQPWDPDFTYGFGYFDWRPGTFSIQYNNYSGNRFPWRSGGDDQGRFMDGEISVSWSWAF